MLRDELSLKYINLRAGGITREPVNDGVYLKSIVKVKEDAMVLYPTTTCVQIFDGRQYYSELKLNLYKKLHPDFERERENFRKLLACQGISEAYSTRLTYITDEVAVVDGQGIYLHGTGASISTEDYDLYDEPMQFHADAIITDRRNVGLISYAADCPTAFLRDAETGAIGVLHSTWKGLVIEHEDGEPSSIVKTTVEAMEDNFGTKPENLEVTIFPCIGPNQFEVGGDVVMKFYQHGLDEFVHGASGGRFFIDLTGTVTKLFMENGVRPYNIEKTPYTTADYGLNSLRMSPTNYYGESGIAGIGVRDSIEDYSKEPEIYSDAEKERRMVRANASNFLIAVRN